MEELFKRFLDFLPIPFLAAAAAVAAVAWLVKQLRPGSEYGEVLKDKTFRRAAVFILAVLLIYLGVRSAWTKLTGADFVAGEKGICVAEFKDDKDDVLQRHTVEQLRTLMSDDPSLATVRVEPYPVMPTSDSEARVLADRHHAVATIWGTVISGLGVNMVQFEVTPRLEQHGIRKFCPKYPDIGDFTQGFVAFVRASVPAASTPQEDTQNLYIQQQLRELKADNQRLTAFVTQLQREISSRGSGKGLTNDGEAVTQTVQTQAVNANRRRFGLFVGITNYPGLGAQFRLMFPSKDAQDMAAAFRASSAQTNHVNLLLDSRATRANVLSGMSEISREVQPDDQVWLYFAGTGFRYGAEETSYMALADAQANNLQANSLSGAELLRWIQGLKAKQVMVLLDSCYSGFDLSRHRGIDVKRLRALDESRSGRVVLAASGADEFALEETKLGHGLFTYYVLQGLAGKADPTGDGYITAYDLFKYVQVAVMSHSPYQHPSFTTLDGTADFAVASVQTSAQVH